MKKNKKINILFILGWPLGQGGHINSTMALVVDLIKNESIGKIILLAPYGEKADLFTKEGIEYISLRNLSNNKLFALNSFTKIIYYTIKFRISIIHAMDYKALLAAIIANTLIWKKIVFTKAGGKPLSFKLPQTNALIVFSKELIEAYKLNHYFYDQSMIFLIKERLSIKNIDKLKNKFTVIENSIFIAMRLMEAKRCLLNNFFEELDKIKSPKKRLTVFIAGDGELMEYCKNRASHISKKKKIYFTFLGEINNKELLMKYYSESMIIVGHGRGIMEAMAIGKAVVLLGFDTIGTVLINSSNINQISDYNFSGRNLIKDETNISLASLINRLWENKISLNSYEEFNKEYIKREYDSKIGSIKTYEIYNKIGSYQFNHFLNNIKWLVLK